MNTDIACADGTTPIGTYKGGKVEVIGGTIDMTVGKCNAQLIQYGDGANKEKRWPPDSPMRYEENSVLFDGVTVLCGKRSYLLRIVDQAKEHLGIPDPAAITTVKDTTYEGCKGVVQP